jgi:hypothetical protein
MSDATDPTTEHAICGAVHPTATRPSRISNVFDAVPVECWRDPGHDGPHRHKCDPINPANGFEWPKPESWHCAQVPNGMNPVVICEAPSLRAEVSRLTAENERLRAEMGIAKRSLEILRAERDEDRRKAE